MLATNIHTIRVSVIALLKKAGYTPIEATQRWDTTYSRQYKDAPPNVIHAWVIGDYKLEFIKQGGNE